VIFWVNVEVIRSFYGYWWSSWQGFKGKPRDTPWLRAGVGPIYPVAVSVTSVVLGISMQLGGVISLSVPSFLRVVNYASPVK
jgi:hypothetical protein